MIKKKMKDIVKGDTFAYEIVNDEEFKGRYLILWNTGLIDEKYGIKHFFRVKITKDNKLPKNEKEFQMLEDVITTITFMEARFFPLSGNDIKSINEEINEKSKVKVEADEMDYLYSYTMYLHGLRKLYKDLIYLGNYNININTHPIEFIPFGLINLFYAFHDSIESELVERYRDYNLRECGLWDYTPEQRDERRKETYKIINIGKNLNNNSDTKV